MVTAEQINGFLKGSNQALFELRLSICKKNECGQYNENATCAQCGCQLADKARDPKGKCPLMPPKW